MRKEFKDYKGQDGYLYFYADWCDVCKMATPIIEDISKNNDVYYCNVDEYFKEAMDYGVNSIPTLVLVKGGDIENVWIGTDISEVTKR